MKGVVFLALVGLVVLATFPVFAGAGESSFRISDAIQAGKEIITTGIEENGRIKRDKERTEQERIRKEERIGTEKIREKSDVSREAIRTDKPATIAYTRGGETITVDIKKTQDEITRLEAENAKLRLVLENLRLQLEKERLQQRH